MDERYNKGYDDGLSCCRLHGKQVALKILGSKDRDSYIRGKQIACLDWLDLNYRPRITTKAQTI